MPATKAFLRALRKKHHLGEFRLKRKKSSKRKKIYPKKIKRRVQNMARKRYRSRSSSGFGGGKLMRGLFTPKGIIASALIGAATGLIAERVIGQPLGQWTAPAAGFVTGGIGGAAGAYAIKMLPQLMGGQASASATAVY